MTDTLLAIARGISQERGMTLVGPAGEGAFKRTYQVSLPDGSRRALKIYKDARRSERTERELSAMTRCAHPRLVRVHSVDTFGSGDEARLYLIEEYLEGGSLGAACATDPLRRQDLLALGAEITTALAHLHEQRLVHRDIKPENIMFRAAGADPVLVDLGLVRDLARSSITETWAIQGPGTPLYSAPEQLTNMKHLIDWRTDQFSLGLTLGVCGAGVHPHAREGDGDIDAIERVARHEPVADTFAEWARNQGLDVVLQMLHPWPIGRFRTPQELLRAFQES